MTAEAAPMQGWHSTPLSPDLRVDVVPRPTRPGKAVLAEIDRLWDQARSIDPSLFNGRVFSADSVSSGCIVGHWTDYKFGFAQIRRPELHAVLGVRPVAVCGVVCCPDGIVFGRRNARSFYQAGMWQTPPAGSVERRDDDPEHVDLRAQLAAELEEELGLPWRDVRSVRPLSAVAHPGSLVLDIGFAIWTERSGSEIVDAQRQASGRAEYDEIIVVPVAQVDSQVTAWATTLVPPAHAFLALAVSGLS